MISTSIVCRGRDCEICVVMVEWKFSKVKGKTKGEEKGRKRTLLP